MLVSSSMLSSPFPNCNDNSLRNKKRLPLEFFEFKREPNLNYSLLFLIKSFGMFYYPENIWERNKRNLIEIYNKDFHRFIYMISIDPEWYTTL